MYKNINGRTVTVAEWLAEKEIDEVAGRYVSDATPGFSMLLAKDGEVLFRKAYGMADLEHSIHIRPSDHFIIASNTKQFTCLSVLLLRSRGLIDLDESIARFFPDFPEYKNEVTVRMLMCHTSGIMEYFETDFEKNLPRLRTAETADLIEIAKSYGNKLNFMPDTGQSYCNTAYVMLGSIIEQLSGMRFGEFLKKEIFDILEMDHSLAPDHMDQKDPDQVFGYRSADSDDPAFVRVPYDMLEIGYADGNISTSVDDILRWHQYLFNEDDDRIVPYEVRREMWEPHVLKTGEKTNYGLGIMTGDFDEDHRTVSDRRELWHTGGAEGFISRISYFPDDKISAVMLTNWNGIERDALFTGMMKAFFRYI
ncbi:MAG: beta-lactamase family protein [Eubacterium sp.]|nr:beta-lactamase family protein [Eubacterium sp.]